MPVNEAIGYGQQAKALLTTYKDAMIAKDSDPTARITRLETKVTTVTNENQKQEAIKTTLRDQTTLVEEKKDDLERESSSACDAIIAAFGRDSEQGREATKLRSSVTSKRSKQSGTPPPTPPAQ
jgi:peptide subunit release factor RF-3